MRKIYFSLNKTLRMRIPISVLISDSLVPILYISNLVKTGPYSNNLGTASWIDLTALRSNQVPTFLRLLCKIYPVSQPSNEPKFALCLTQAVCS